VRELRHKNLAIGTAIIFFPLTLVAVLAAFSMMQAINPIAAFTAITVGIIGIAWFKKTSK
jgi:hypothetical protein